MEVQRTSMGLTGDGLLRACRTEPAPGGVKRLVGGFRGQVSGHTKPYLTSGMPISTNSLSRPEPGYGADQPKVLWECGTACRLILAQADPVDNARTAGAGLYRHNGMYVVGVEAHASPAISSTGRRPEQEHRYEQWAPWDQNCTAVLRAWDLKRRGSKISSRLGKRSGLIRRRCSAGTRSLYRVDRVCRRELSFILSDTELSERAFCSRTFLSWAAQSPWRSDPRSRYSGCWSPGWLITHIPARLGRSIIAACWV